MHFLKSKINTFLKNKTSSLKTFKNILYFSNTYSVINIVGKSLHFSFFAKKRRKFQNLCKESKEIAKEKKMKILTVFMLELKDLIIYFSF